MSQTDEEETSEIESFILDQESFGSDTSALASKLALLAATGQASLSDGASDDQISVDAETQARLEALLEAAGIGKLSTSDGKAFADPEVLKRLSSSVSCALDEAAAALSKMKTENEAANEHSQERTLVEACSEGDVNTVRKLLCEGRSANETTEDGESLLSLACSAGYYELVEVLLSVPPYSDEATYLTSEHSLRLRHKINSSFLSTLNHQLTKVLLAMHANVEDCGAKGDCTPLMEAASGGYTDIVKLLLAHGADVNATSTTGNTALTYACCGGYEDVVKLLVDAGAKLECHNENGHTPLMEAASGGHVNVAAILLECGAGINTHSNEFKESALTLACYKGHLQMVRFLLQAGADQEHKTDEMHTALMEASMDGHVEVARLLLDSGAQVNMPADSFESPLTLAACGGHVELAELLIERGAALEEVNDEGYTPLMEAAREGHEEMVALLLAKNANVNAKTEETQETALTLACCGGFLECAELLVRAGGNIETGCSTPLMEAAQEGQLDLVKFLIQKGANVNATTSSGDTALSYACEHGHTDVADVLLAAGADLEHETEGGRTPLMKAARAGHLCTVQFLISRGADVNRTTKNNEHSVLSLACVCGHLSVVELLLCQGADPTQTLKDGSTMLLESSKGGHTAIVRLLLDFPHNFLSLPPETSQVASPTPEQVPPRVPTQSLPMVVPPQEPDQAPQLPLASGCDHFPEVMDLIPPSDLKLPEGNEKATTALVTQLIQQGNLLSQADYLPPDTKLAVDKDVAFTVEKFLQSMACDAAAGKTRTAESIVEEAQGKLTELEQRIKEAIEKNAQLKNIEMMQTDQLTKEKVEELYKTREEQVLKKQKILEELQKVERELQLKTQQQLKQHYMDMKQAEASTLQRGKPDGEDTSSIQQPETNPLPPGSEHFKGKDVYKGAHTSQQTPQIPGPSNAVVNSNKQAQALHKLNNGSSGSLPQAVKDVDESFCQCVHHPCNQLSHPSPSEVSGDPRLDMQQSLPVAPGLVPPSSVVPYPHLDIDGYTESNHDTPLTLACAGGHEDLVQLLITRGANIEHRDKKGFTPLILAATAGHVGVVSILLEASADIEAQSERTKDTPLSLACSGGRLDVVELLLERGANKEHRNVSDYTPLSLAASGGYVSIIKLLLNHGAEINSRTGSKLGISPLMLAAMNGHTQAVQLLLDMGADINAQIETNRNTALTLACFQGRHEVVSLLVDRKANVEHRAKTGLTPLMEAASGGYAEVGRVLLDKGADPNAPPVPSSRDTALTIAADKGHYRFCELVLNRGAQVEVKNKKGNTPLWLACNGGHLDVVMLLVGKRADVNAADNRSVIPLMAAFRKGHVQVVKWLAKEVSQFPSDAECMRYIATITDRELLKRSHQCMECIAQAKDRQAQEANKVASELLEEVEFEKKNAKNRKEKAARKQAKKRQKRKQKSKKTDGEKDDKDEMDDMQDDDVLDKAGDVNELIMDTDKLKIGEPPMSTATYNTAPAPVVSKIVTTITSGDHSVPMATDVSHANKVKPASLPPVSISLTPQIILRTDEKKKEERKKVHLSTKESPVSSSGGESSPRSASRKTRRSAASQRTAPTSRATTETTTNKASARVPPSGHRNVAATPSPGKRPPRREEGWKEVQSSRKFPSNAAKRIMVSSNLISRVIGRGGSNINAIREVTAAHIDIDKQRKGGLERTVTIKGSADSIKHAYQLITALIKEDRTDQEITSIISKVQAQAAQNAAAKQPVQKPPMTVVAAPIPTKPAWTVPPSIVAQASSQSRQPAPTSSVKPAAWSTTALATSATTATTSSSNQNKWSIPSTTATTTTNVATVSSPPTVESVKKVLFVTSQSVASSAPSVPTVSFPKTSDKPATKPIQPVAPMVSTKVTPSAPMSRAPVTSFGPVGSGVPTIHQQVHPSMAPTQGQMPPSPLTTALSNASLCQNMGVAEPLSPGEITSPTENPVMRMTAQGALSPPQPPSSSVGMQHTVSMTPTQNRVTPGPTGVAPLNSRTPVHGTNPNAYVNSNNVSTGIGSSFSQIMSGPAPMSTPSFSPFSNSFTPSAGSTALWNNDSASGSPYQTPAPPSGMSQMPDEPVRSHVDQSKAPGYRGNMKSPIIENGVIGGGSVSTASNMENASPVGSQHGSPSNNANDGDLPNKPRPIGTERAHNRKTNPPLPLTTVVGQPATNIWSYDKLPPAHLGMDSLDQNKYPNWSTVIPSVQLKDATVTTSTANRPQVTTSEAESLKSNNIIEQQNPVQANVINRPFPNAVPSMGVPGRMPPTTNRFSQPSNAGRVAPQAPIGSHLGGSSSVGVVGPQQHNSNLQPIGSHLGGAGHMRNNASFQPIQRNFPSNQLQTRYPMAPYYMQNDVSRYVQGIGSDMTWQQQQQQQHAQQQQQQQQQQQ